MTKVAVLQMRTVKKNGEKADPSIVKNDESSRIANAHS